MSKSLKTEEVLEPIARTYRSSRTYQFSPENGEKVTGNSETIPDMVPSMREILQRYTMGITDNVSHLNNYSGDLPDLRNTEPHVLQELMQANLEDYNYLSALAEKQALELREAEQKEKRELARKMYEELKNEES